MSKAEKFISNCIRNCSNEIGYCHNKTRNHNHVFYPWLTLDQARNAVEIARKEMIEWLKSHYRDYMHNPTGKRLEAFFGIDMCNDLEEAMKDE